MTTLHGILLRAGLLLILGGFLFGLLFSFAEEHKPRLLAYEDYRPVLEHIAERPPDSEWQKKLTEQSAASVAHRRATDVHGHAINMGVLLILLGLLAPMLAANSGRGAPGDRRLVIAMATGAFVYPAGLFLQYLTFTLAGEVFAALGALLAILALAALYRRLWQAVDRVPKSEQPEER